MRPGSGDGRDYGWSDGTKEGSTVEQWRFEVSNRSGFVDARGQAVLEDMKVLLKSKKLALNVTITEVAPEEPLP